MQREETRKPENLWIVSGPDWDVGERLINADTVDCLQYVRFGDDPENEKVIIQTFSRNSLATTDLVTLPKEVPDVTAHLAMEALAYDLSYPEPGIFALQLKYLNGTLDYRKIYKDGNCFVQDVNILWEAQGKVGAQE